MAGLRSLVADKFHHGVLWNIASLGIAGVSGMVLVYLIGAVYNAAALGVFNQVFAYILFSQFAVLGIQYSVLRHIAASRDTAEHRAIIRSALAITACLSLAVAVLFWLSADPAADLLDSPDVAGEPPTRHRDWCSSPSTTWF